MSPQPQDYTCHGTAGPFAALQVAIGKVHGRCSRRHRHVDFIAFLDSLAKRSPRLKLDPICDTCGAHKHPAVKQCPAAHRRSRVHFTPTSASRLSLVEPGLGLITSPAIRRGSFHSYSSSGGCGSAWNSQPHSPG